MPFCIPETLVKKFIKDLPKDIDSLMKKTSAERRAIFEKSVGKENARQVNAEFESKILLKNQQQGMVNWVKKVTKMTEPVKRDLLSRVERMQKVLSPAEQKLFLEDIAARKLGFEVSVKDAGRIADLAKAVESTKTAMETGGSRIDYGNALVKFQKYTADLKLQASKKSFIESVRSPREVIGTIGGTTKSVLSSMDNSFFGRQGLKVLLTKPDIWVRNFKKSWSDIGKALKGGEPVDAIKAEIYSRQNALNGKYKKMKIDIGLSGEEAFPSSLPEKIPILKNLFKASEQAYNGAALRMRADLADVYIKIAERKGVNMLDPLQARPIGRLVNSMTGRGSIGKAEAVAKEANALFFSVKKAKADLDLFTQPFMAATPVARQIAAKNLISNIGATAAFMYITNLAFPEAIELDPRSSNFGTIKVGDSRIDFTGGARSLTTLASRLVPTKHDGKWGRWFKSSTSDDKWTFLSDAKFGQMTGLDVFESYLEGKLSPVAGAIRDELKNTMYDGSQTTTKKIITKNLTPLPFQTAHELLTEENAGPLGLLLLESVGFGVNTYGKK